MADFEIKIMKRCEEINRDIYPINISQFEHDKHDFLENLNDCINRLRDNVDYFYSLMSAKYNFENIKRKV